MGEYIKREIKPFNEFWINCESTMLHSLLITLDEKYRVMAYTNNYVYEVLHFPTPSRKWINEVRVKPEIMDIFHVVLKNCRMKANRLLIEYLIEKEMIVELAPLLEDCHRIERRWTAIKNKVSKAYFAESSVAEMMNLGEQMMEQFVEERKMWKAFIKLYDKRR